MRTLFLAAVLAAALAAPVAAKAPGDPARQKLNEPDTQSIGDRIETIRDGHWQTRQMPTRPKGAAWRSPRLGWMRWSAT